MSWKKVKLKQILKQYRIEHIVQNDIEYKQVTISKYDGVTFRGTKMGKEIGRKRQFQIDLKKYPNTLMFVRQGVQDGSIGIAPIEVDGCIATENMPMFSVEGINLEYLKFLLKSPYFYDELNKIKTTGSAQKSIHEREILEIEIPFPNIEEQEEIVKELIRKKDNSFAISTELTHQLSLLKKLRQQFLQDAVQGKLVDQNKKDEPASELLKKIKADKEKLIAEKKLKKEKELPPIKPEEIPFEIPENWKWCRLGEICTKITDGFHNTPPKVSEGIPYIAATQVKSDKIDWDNCNYVDEKYHRELYIKAYPQKGELLVVNIGAGCGTPALIDVDFEFSFKNTAILKFNQNLISNKLLFYYFLLRKDEIYAELTKGGLQPFLSLKILNEIDFPLPPIAEQNRIVQKIDELMQYCNDLEASIKQSESQNEKLLQQVLREALRKEPVEEEV
ncbi:MAG: restriction endonuclease subunit S [Bacteroidetes bacterium]|nr:restriction endonuclease subunit S [Bacteroidota bacterium]